MTDKQKDKQDIEQKKLDQQAKALLFCIGMVGCLLLACGAGVIFGWGWFLVVMGLVLLLIFALGIVSYIIGEWNDDLKEGK